jgi:hypothetical protein
MHFPFVILPIAFTVSYTGPLLLIAYPTSMSWSLFHVVYCS